MQAESRGEWRQGAAVHVDEARRPTGPGAPNAERG